MKTLGCARLALVTILITSACGSSGSSGSDGSAGAQGSGSAGTGGSSGMAGTQGSAGAQGAAGTRGSAGTHGAAGAGGSGATGGSSASVWRPFADTSVWNTPIPSNATVDPNSATMITDFSTISGQTNFWINIQDYSVPVYFVDSTSTPTVTVMAGLGGTGFRTGAADDGTVPGTGPAPIPSGAMPAAGSDKHLSIVDRQANKEWGFWDADDSTGSWTAGLAATMDLSGSGARPPERNNPWWAGHGPRACGFGGIAGLITVAEMQAGSIEHALVIGYSDIRSSTYTPPASSGQGTGGTAMKTRGILCGGRIQLDPTLDLSTLGLSASGLIIARALQKYGAFIGDLSGATSLYADGSPTAQAVWSAGLLANGEAQPIPLNRFRVLTIGTTYDNMN